MDIESTSLFRTVNADHLLQKSSVRQIPHISKYIEWIYCQSSHTNQSFDSELSPRVTDEGTQCEITKDQFLNLRGYPILE